MTNADTTGWVLCLGAERAVRGVLVDCPLGGAATRLGDCVTCRHLVSTWDARHRAFSCATPEPPLAAVMRTRR